VKEIRKWCRTRKTVVKQERQTKKGEKGGLSSN